MKSSMILPQQNTLGQIGGRRCTEAMRKEEEDSGSATAEAVFTVIGCVHRDRLYVFTVIGCVHRDRLCST